MKKKEYVKPQNLVFAINFTLMDKISGIDDGDDPVAKENNFVGSDEDDHDVWED